MSKTFVFICRQKLNFIPYAFIEILQRYANLFWLLWACLVTLTQNDSITVQKTSMFTCMQKINNSWIKMIHKSLLPYDITFCQICWWNINRNISFHFRLFPVKTNIITFLKKSKKTYFEGYSGPFLFKFWQK